MVMLLRAVLEALCAFWMIGLGLSWLRKDWKIPTRSLTPAVLGSAVFYWCVLARFMENSSSWHRVAPTAMVWQLLAGLLLAAGLPLILPQMNARSLYLAGMLAFACAGSARRLAIAGVLELISLCSYMEAIFNCTIIPMNVLSLMAIACATVILLELLDKLGIKGALSRESNA